MPNDILSILCRPVVTRSIIEIYRFVYKMRRKLWTTRTMPEVLGKRTKTLNNANSSPANHPTNPPEIIVGDEEQGKKCTTFNNRDH